LFLFTGLLGGFTTFSAFAYEGAFLFRRHEILTALSYATLSVVGGLVLVFLGLKCVNLLWPAAH
jgi:fluoride exporter